MGKVGPGNMLTIVICTCVQIDVDSIKLYIKISYQSILSRVKHNQPL